MPIAFGLMIICYEKERGRSRALGEVGSLNSDGNHRSGVHRNPMDSNSGPMFDPELALSVVGTAVAGPLIKTALTDFSISRPVRGTVRSAGPAILRHHL